MFNRPKRIALITMAFLVAGAAPALASSVSYSGYGTASSISVNTWRPTGASAGYDASGLLSYDGGGSPVYVSGRVYAGYNPITCGRISSNAPVGGGGLWGGTCSSGGFGVVGEAQFRICRAIANVPDPCGGWGGTIYR